MEQNNKKQNLFQKIFNNKKIRKQITIGLILSLLISSIIIIGYAIHSKPESIWAALCAVQIGVALLWLVGRLGGFSTSRYASRNTARQSLNRKAIKQETKDKYLLKRVDSPLALEEEETKKSKAGIWLMLIIGAIYLIVALIVSFA
ncbi:DUF3899 domain-containing protein [Mycoplasma todarodis]|uniref:DUF3899 domain-containing protein n=1 Tax=Mycoplasma todarodis TaxID=1937191 RepID=UPI003B352F1D